MRLAIAILFSAHLAIAQEAKPDPVARRAALATAQAEAKTRAQRFPQQLAKQATETIGLTYTIERYTHGRNGEGWVVNWFYDDGKTVWHRRENHGPAAYTAHDWRVIE
jgi:hypothetical protein